MYLLMYKLLLLLLLFIVLSYFEVPVAKLSINNSNRYFTLEVGRQWVAWNNYLISTSNLCK